MGQTFFQNPEMEPMSIVEKQMSLVNNTKWN